MPDPRDDYNAALKRVDAAKEELKRIREIVDEVSSGLRSSPPTLTIQNCGETPTWGVDVPGQRTPQYVDGTKWPDGKALASALREYHESLRAAKVAHGVIPAEQRRGVVDPPKM